MSRQEDIQQKKALKNNVKGVLVLRVVSMACSYLMVPLLIGYLDTYKYGIWITIFSIANWFQFLDIGLGNGLRNKFAQSFGIGDINEARKYVSTTYYMISIISLILLVIFGGIYISVDWHNVFNVDQRIGSDLNLVVLFVLASFILSFPLKIINSLLYGAQKSAYANTVNSLSSIFSLLLIWIILEKDNSSNLIYVAFIYSAMPVILFAATNIVFYLGTFKPVRPSVAYIEKKYIGDLTGLGVKFFILQINAVVLFSTNSFIIAHLLGQEKVTEYNVMFRLFNIPYMIFQIILTPYWSAFTKAYAINDFSWIKNNLNTLLKILGLVVLALFLIFIFNKELINLWVGNKITPSMSTAGFLFVYLSIQAAMLPFINFVNGVGKIKLQLYIATIASVINIPLSIFLVRNLSFGLNGVLLGNMICTLPFLILAVTQTYKIINKNKVKGIWYE